MSDIRSAEQIRDKYIAEMGAPLGEVFSALSNDFVGLSWQFDELSELFGGTPERLKVMNRAAPFFFWMLQRTWWNECLLGVTRMLAPLKSMNRENLTVRQLPELIGDPALGGRVQDLIKQAADRAAFATEWRNKKIAHRDRAHALRQATALPAAALTDVADVLDLISQILNEVETHYCKASTMYRKAPISHGVMSLLHAVRDGLRFEDALQKRIADRTYTSEDINDSPPAL